MASGAQRICAASGATRAAVAVAAAAGTCHATAHLRPQRACAGSLRRRVGGRRAEPAAGAPPGMSVGQFAPICPPF